MTLRAHRENAGLTQAELAARAGVSRQLVGAVEAGRHLPRVDAAIALADALSVDVAALFPQPQRPVDVVSGAPSAEGALVRSGRVGDVVVTVPARVGPEGFDVADGVVAHGTLTSFGRRAPGLVVAGCEPGLEVLERMLREAGMGAMAAPASSAAARAALQAGRVHAAVVHGPKLPKPRNLHRFRLTSWRIGMAAPPDAPGGWWAETLGGREPVIQREQGAGVQRAFEEAAGTGVPGPRVGSHLEAARRAMLTGMTAVTIEPAALAVGAAFHALETHVAQLWVEPQWAADRIVTEALHVITSRRFQGRLEGVGGYDLAGCGSRAA